MKARDKRASDGNYYRIKKESISLSVIPKTLMEEYKYLRIPDKWFKHIPIIERCNQKERADWVIKPREKCPYCSDKKCSSLIGRRILLLEFLKGYKETYKKFGKGFLPKINTHSALPLINADTYYSGDIPYEKFALEIYQCYKQRDKFYLVEFLGATRKTPAPFEQRCYVQYWKKNKRCPHCNASHEKISKIKDFKRNNLIEIYQESAISSFYKAELWEYLLAAANYNQDTTEYFEFDSDCGIYTCQTCKEEFFIGPEPHHVFKVKTNGCEED